MKLRPALYISIVLLLTIPACQKEEEILQKAPATAALESASEEGAIPKIKPSVIESEFYQYGKFGDLPYRILFPRSYDSTKTYPLHVFLHGIGERGTDNEQQLELGASLFQADSVREKHPAFIVYPQCPTTAHWMNDGMGEILTGLIETLVSDYMINEERITIGGYSMGAYGTFAMVARNPDLFEAAVAISGDGDEKKASLMSRTKWRIFAGKQDSIVPSSESETMSLALEKAGASVAYTVYPDADHHRTPWIAFAEPDFFSWLFLQK